MLGGSLGCSDYESGVEDSERRKLDKNRVTILDFGRADFILCMDLLEEFHSILSVFKYGIFHAWGWSILTYRKSSRNDRRPPGRTRST